MTLRSASAAAAKSRRCRACSPRSYSDTASCYVGFLGGCGGSRAGAMVCCATVRGDGRVTVVSGGLVALREGRLFLELLAELRDVPCRADPERAVLALFDFWAGLRAEVRGFETRRVFAIYERTISVRRSDSNKSGPNRSRPDETTGPDPRVCIRRSRRGRNASPRVLLRPASTPRHFLFLDLFQARAFRRQRATSEQFPQALASERQ
jgi:hypothetical protein